jgi:hypothetical protein
MLGFMWAAGQRIIEKSLDLSRGRSLEPKKNPISDLSHGSPNRCLLTILTALQPLCRALRLRPSALLEEKQSIHSQFNALVEAEPELSHRPFRVSPSNLSVLKDNTVSPAMTEFSLYFSLRFPFLIQIERLSSAERFGVWRTHKTAILIDFSVSFQSV